MRPNGSRSNNHSEGKRAEMSPGNSFVGMLTRWASTDKYILLTMVDLAFADMAINLYEASLKPNKIDNFLFVGVGLQACQVLWNASLPCHHYTENNESDRRSVYGSAAFIQKMNIRTDMILDALAAGFTVMHCDLDLFFFTNPFTEIKELMLTADIATMWDKVMNNAGFVVVKPSLEGRLVYELVRNITVASPKIDDQKALNTAIETVQNQSHAFVSTVLDEQKYMCGYKYFEAGRRYFRQSCDECRVVHNNWIVGYEAKVYRFKEHHMWFYDKGEYYTSETRKYITYNNTKTFQTAKASFTAQSMALKVALVLGEMLGRVVILPRFHNHSIDGDIIECPLNMLVKVSKLDAVFSGRYRESSFLQHPLVPSSTKSDITKPYFVRALTNDAPADASVIVKAPRTQLYYSDVMKLFGTVPNRVLTFQSLYGAMPRYEDLLKQRSLEARLGQAVKYSNYRQNV
jgi:hypothetical protein